MNKIVKIQKIGVVSAAKIYGLILGIMGFVVGVIIGFFSIVGGILNTPLIGGGGGGFIGTFAFLFVPIIYGSVGFIIGGLIALIYNLIAKKLGGLEVVVESATENS